MLYLMAEFVVGGRQYIYSSPVQVHVGQYVLVNVCGEVKAVRVVSVSTDRGDDYDGPIKSIVGIGYMLEDLEQPVKREPEKRKPSLLSRWLNQDDHRDYDGRWGN